MTKPILDRYPALRTANALLNVRPLLSLSISLAVCAMLTACASLPMVDAPSVNQNSRIQFLVLHFTSLPFDESMRLLTQRTNRPVSVHYLVPEPGDATYSRKDLRIHRLVPEDRRAWHAGKSFWNGKEALNDSSIGIEVVNQSTCESTDPGAEIQTPEMQSCTFLDYPEEQIQLVVELMRDILDRHPEIDPVDVVGHSDIAPNRRLDPGPTFPWKRLYEHGIGAWYDDPTVDEYQRRFESSPPSIEILQRGLRAYGYPVEETGELDVQTRFALKAFQMHFRPSKIDGQADKESLAILFALLEKYRSRALSQIF